MKKIPSEQKERADDRNIAYNDIEDKWTKVKRKEHQICLGNLIERKPSDDYKRYRNRLIEEIVKPLLEKIRELANACSRQGKLDNILDNFRHFIKTLRKQKSTLEKAATMKTVKSSETEIVRAYHALVEKIPQDLIPPEKDIRAFLRNNPVQLHKRIVTKPPRSESLS